MLWLIKNIPKILSRMLNIRRNILKYSGKIILKLYQKICYFTYSFCINRSVFFSVTSVIAFILGIGVFVAAIVWAFQYLNRKYPASAGKVSPPDAKNGQTQQQGLEAGQSTNPADLLAQLAQNSQSAKQTPDNNANITTPVENSVNNQNNNNNNNSNNNNVSSTPSPNIANTINPINNLNNNSNNNNINPIAQQKNQPSINPVNNMLNNNIPSQPPTSLSAKSQNGNASNSPTKINNPSLNGLGDLSSLFNKTTKPTNNIPSNSGQSINNLDSLNNNNNAKSSPNS